MYASTLRGILASALSPSDLELYDQQEDSYCATKPMPYCKMAYRTLAIERWVLLMAPR
jgi:hypothetical protein